MSGNKETVRQARNGHDAFNRSPSAQRQKHNTFATPKSASQNRRVMEEDLSLKKAKTIFNNGNHLAD